MSDVDVLRNGIAEFFEVGVLLFVTDAALSQNQFGMFGSEASSLWQAKQQ